MIIIGSNKMNNWKISKKIMITPVSINNAMIQALILFAMMNMVMVMVMAVEYKNVGLIYMYQVHTYDKKVYKFSSL